MLLTCDPKQFPTSPGVYLMKDAQDVVLYVGKAKNLRTRLRSYLRPDGDGRPQIRFLQERTARIETIVTDTEKEALILENTLIKRYRPRYNLHLRDDKTYVSIRIDPQEEFPALRVVRQTTNDGALYFGPFSSSAAVRETLKEIYRIFPLRHYPLATCRQRHRPCLFHQIGQCSAPCHGLISATEYTLLVQGAVALLSGRGKEVLGLLRERMQTAAEQLRFEEAARLRDQLAAISQTVEQQKVISHGGGDCDVFGLWQDGSRFTVAVLIVRQGRLLDKRHFVVTWELDAQELASAVIQQYYTDGQVLPAEILLSIPLGDGSLLGEWLSERRGARVVLHTPRRGDKLRLVELACRNAREQQSEATEMAARANALLLETQRVLQLVSAPLRIECYDISHTQGQFTTASMVVFLGGRPAPREYRSFTIRSVDERPDDYAAMHEVLVRRLHRGLTEGALPQLMLVDGGKGQLAVLRSVLTELRLENTIEIAAIAKGRKSSVSDDTMVSESKDRVFRPGNPRPINFDASSPVRHLLAQLRDEAHRFALAQQRKKRSMRLLHSQLEDLPGIGKKLRLRLLKHFGSYNNVKRASLTDLLRVPGVGLTMAQNILSALAKTETRI